MAQRVDTGLTPEERAEVMRIQDRLIDLLVDRGDAVTAGNVARANALQGEIEDLLRERDDIRMWAAASAK
jgi:predicted nucleic acid-binding protein